MSIQREKRKEVQLMGTYGEVFQISTGTGAGDNGNLDISLGRMIEPMEAL